MNYTQTIPTKQKETSFEDLIKLHSVLSYKFPKDLGDLPAHKTGLLEKIMNKLGWYKQTTVYLIDKNALISTKFKPLSEVCGTLKAKESYPIDETIRGCDGYK